MLASVVIDEALALSDSVSDDYTTAQILQWVNEAQRQVGIKTDFRESTSTGVTVADATSTYEITAPSNFLKIKSFFFNTVEAIFVEFKEFRNLVNDATAQTTGTSTPTYYTIWNGVIEVYVYGGSAFAAGLAYTLYYISYPTDITMTTDSVDIPTTYMDALAFYVAYKMLLINGEPTAAQASLFYFVSRIQDSKARLRISKRWPSRVQMSRTNKYGF